MEFNLNEILPSNWLHALGATLFHSLWLGVVLSLLVALILFFTRKASATLRYNLLTASLFFFVFAIGLIFYNSLGIESSGERIRLVTTNFDLKLQTQENKSVQANFQSGVNNIISIWDAYASQIVLIWFLVICIKSIQLVTGLTSIYHIKNNKVYPAGQKWEEKVVQLSQRLGINRKVNILQSGIAQVPMVVGHLKPLILVPLGLINGLSNDEVEAILCHELAHVKRRDYLVNLLQSFIEVVFFFNPAVLWLSKLIKEERENCCDDLAVSQMDDKRSYVKALITCQEFQLNGPSLAMAVTGRKNHLFNRISRMLFDTKKTLNKMEKTILTVALVSVVICSAAFKNVSKSGTSLANNSYSYRQSVQDTTKKKRAQAETDRKQAIKDAKQAQEDSKQAIIDSKQAIEDAKQAGEDAKVAAEDAKLAKQDALQAEIDTKIAREEAKMHNNIKALEAAKAAKENSRQAQIDTKIAIEHARQAQVNAKIAQKNAEIYKNNNQNFNASQVPAAPSTSAPLSPVVPPAPPTFQSTPPRPAQNTNREEHTSTTKSKTGTQRTIESVSSTGSDAHDYKSIIKQMLQDGIIKNSVKLSYKLDKNSLIINGVKQAENYHQKYKNKYLQSDNTALVYNYELTSYTATTP